MKRFLGFYDGFMGLGFKLELQATKFRCHALGLRAPLDDVCEAWEFRNPIIKFILLNLEPVSRNPKFPHQFLNPKPSSRNPKF